MLALECSQVCHITPKSKIAILPAPSPAPDCPSYAAAAPDRSSIQPSPTTPSNSELISLIVNRPMSIGGQ